MRSVEYFSSQARPRAVSEAATQRTAASVAGPARPRDRAEPRASTPARRERLGEPPRSATPSASRRSSISSSASAASSASSAVQRGGPRRAPRAAGHELLGLLALDAGLDERRRASRPRTSIASTSSPAARRAAAAGLLSSWARPAAIVPSAARRSRFCSIAVTRVMTGAIWRMMRRWTGRSSSASSRKRSVGTSATRQAVSARMRTPSGPRSARRSRRSRSARPGGRSAPRGRRARPARSRPSPPAAAAARAGLALLVRCTSPGATSSSSARGGPRARGARRRARRRGRRGAGRRRRASSRSCLGQVLVDQRHRHRALPHRAGHALDRARAHVAGDEHARDARLQHVGVAASGQPAPRASAPARMKPRSSRATTPSSQSVRGAAPMKTKQASTSSRRSSPSAPRIVSARRRPSVALRGDRLAAGAHVDVRAAPRSAR